MVFSGVQISFFEQWSNLQSGFETLRYGPGGQRTIYNFSEKDRQGFKTGATTFYFT